MNPRPVIFVSAVSKELKTARGFAARLLHSMGYDPKDQDMARAEHGRLTDVLRRWIDQSQGVIQLVGKCYGAEPAVPEPGFPRHSYTQFEALYAHSIGKPVWYFFVGEGFTADARDPEPADLAALQQGYTAGIRATGDLRHTFATDAELEVRIRRIESQLATLRAEWEAHRTRVEHDLALTVSATSQILDGQHRQDAAIADLRQMMESLVRGGSAEKLTQDYDAALAFIASRHAMSAGALRTLLAERADRVVGDAHAELREKVRVLREAGRFTEARDFAVEAAARLERTRQQSTKDEVEMLLEASQSERAMGHYTQAHAYAEKAGGLADPRLDFAQWAHARQQLARALQLEGRHDDSFVLLRELVPLQTKEQGPEHPDTLLSRNWLATALNRQGKAAQAEVEHRAVLAIRERVLGGEHPDTLSSWSNLALALDAQGKNAEAEVENRAVLALRERVLGAEHPETLMSRNNLANALLAQGKNAEAETEYSLVRAIMQRVLGAEHPDTLTSRNNLAEALQAQGKHAEAEAEHRSVLAIQERVLGAEHPDVAQSCYNLSLCLEALGRKQEALGFARRALEVWRKALGAEHPYTKEAQAMVARLSGGGAK